MRKILWLLLLCVLVYLTYSWYTQEDVSTQASPQTHTHIQTSERVQRTVTRINQLDPSEYNSQQDYTTWAYSTCSTASMTVVINSYGHTYRIADILKVEANLGEITPDLGLVEPEGIARTVTYFGFSARYLSQATLQQGVQQIEAIANGGHPIIVAFPPETYAGGHIFVVDGSTRLYYAAKKKWEIHLIITDSAKFNWRFMPEENFLKYWRGFAVEVTPKGMQV